MLCQLFFRSRKYPVLQLFRQVCCVIYICWNEFGGWRTCRFYWRGRELVRVRGFVLCEDVVDLMKFLVLVYVGVEKRTFVEDELL